MLGENGRMKNKKVALDLASRESCERWAARGRGRDSQLKLKFPGSWVLPPEIVTYHSGV